MDEPNGTARRSPPWLIPALICAVAVIGGFLLKLSFDRQLAAPGPERDVSISAGPREATAAPIGPESEQPSLTDADTGRGSDDDGAARGGIERLDRVGWVNPRTSTLPWSAAGAVDGLLTFRGNPTRTFYGRGPVPQSPRIEWEADIGCSNSSVGGVSKTWCGTGWTGQPAVFIPPEATSGGLDWWVAVGGYNRSVNFFDPETGREAYPPFQTGDIIKGSITVDPDGYPLVYTGSRDNYFHIAAIDRDEPEELWRLSATSVDPTLWNNDWDSSAMVIDDHLLVGGENSRFYIVRLNRGFDSNGVVTVDPEVVFSVEGWDDELLQALGDRQVSIENSVAVSGTVVYFANSGGLVQGWDLGPVLEGGEPSRVFRFWTGDDTDASIVIDSDGMLYVGSQFERGNARARTLGQVFKLDPSRPDDPLVWSREAATADNTGVWATPAIHGPLLIVPTHDGRLIGFDRVDGDTRWTIELPGPLWSSPAVVDGVLIQGDCAGTLHGFDVSDPEQRPEPLWSVDLGGCIESTPAVWDGRIFVGTRSGTFYAIAD